MAAAPAATVIPRRVDRLGQPQLGPALPAPARLPRLSRLSCAGRGHLSEGAGRAQLHQLGENGDGHLLVRCLAEVEARGRVHPVELVPGHAALGQVAEHRLGPAAGRDQAEVQAAG